MGFFRIQQHLVLVRSINSVRFIHVKACWDLVSKQQPLVMEFYQIIFALMVAIYILLLSLNIS